MFPTHLAVGYLMGAYSRFPVAYAVFGSILPDLVDRPLFWVGLTPFTHTVAHSIAVAVPACAVAIAVFGRRGAAVAIGWAVHLAADFVNVLTTQEPSILPYYILYFSPPPDGPAAFAVVTIPVPATDIGHTVHPLVLLSEVGLLAWGLVVVRRGRTVPQRLRRTKSG